MFPAKCHTCKALQGVREVSLRIADGDVHLKISTRVFRLQTIIAPFSIRTLWLGGALKRLTRTRSILQSITIKSRARISGFVLVKLQFVRTRETLGGAHTHTHAHVLNHTYNLWC